MSSSSTSQPAIEMDSFRVQHELGLPPLELNASPANAFGTCIPVK